MAFARSGGTLVSTPRLVTVAVSVLMVAAALLSLRFHLPTVQAYVAPHRFALMAGGYGVLLAGVLLRRL